VTGAMSALGQKQTSTHIKSMSALAPNADIRLVIARFGVLRLRRRLKTHEMRSHAKPTTVPSLVNIRVTSIPNFTG